MWFRALMLHTHMLYPASKANAVQETGPSALGGGGGHRKSARKKSGAKPASYCPLSLCAGEEPDSDDESNEDSDDDDDDDDDSGACLQRPAHLHVGVSP